ncbi:MAG: hypothetical protein WA843_00830 [Candidatus Saccharimonadales bacterium]
MSCSSFSDGEHFHCPYDEADPRRQQYIDGITPETPPESPNIEPPKSPSVARKIGNLLMDTLNASPIVAGARVFQNLLK